MAHKPRQLREISIRNIGVIEEATLNFGPGFTVITGETGAGKTMVLTGLNLLAGSRSDTDLIRSGKDRLSVAASVGIGSPVKGKLKGLLEEHDPEVEDDSLLLQRVITREGRGKAAIGADPATVGLLADFASEFFTIHGQSTNIKLAESEHQLALLDQSSGGISEQRLVFREALTRWRDRMREISTLRRALQDRDSQIASLEKFISDIERIKLIPDEWVDIEERIKRLDSVEEYRVAFATAVAAIDDETLGAITQLGVGSRALEPVKGGDRNLTEIYERMRLAMVDLRDVVAELSTQLDQFEVEPGELDRLRERRAALRQFLNRQQVFHTTGSTENESLNELLESIDEQKELLKGLRDGDDRLAEMERECSALESRALESAIDLRRERKKAAKSLEKFINEELANLGLKGSRFSINFTELPKEKIGSEGVDEIEFLFSAHQGGTPLPLSKGISGGELSRVMLAIELALVEERDVGALIFDEIDSGIGGETGLLIGERISRLARRYQVIVITHLAQVAAWADSHFRIEKNEDGDFVLSSIVKLDHDERVLEIARMLSGQSDLEAARIHARELLKHAGK